MRKLAFLVVILWTMGSLAAQQVSKTLSVTTFSNTSARSEFEWLNTALSDMLTTDLSSVKRLSVVQRNRLGELLKEQEFQASGIVDEKSAVAAGKILGADTLIFGDFILVGKDQVRINANLVSVQNGKSLGAASATGTTENIFVLEKLIAVRLLETLGIALSDAERVDLFQMPSRSAAALEENYRGVFALERNDAETARSYFEKATTTDPFYRDARRNLEKASFTFSGSDLAKSADDDARRRDAQLKAAKALRDDLLRNLFVFKITGNPRVVRTDAKAGTVDVAIDWTAAYNPDTVRHLDAFFADLVRSKSGDEDGTFTLRLPGSSQNTVYNFRWYSEVKAALLDSDYGIQAFWLPVFSLTDAAGKPGGEILHGVRCSMPDGDIIGDDANLWVYKRGGFADFKQMYIGSVWALQSSLKPEFRLAILRGIKRSDVDTLTKVKVGLAAVRVATDGDWTFVTF